MNRCSRLARISVVILIRTDTTLDHSQKAEKVCPLCSDSVDNRCVYARRNVSQTPHADGNKSLQKLVSRINAPLSRQPLVKGERLVRGEVSAAMPFIRFLGKQPLLMGAKERPKFQYGDGPKAD